jgi:transcription initiation factor TFIID subunit 6
MSIISPDSIKAIANSVDIHKLSDDAANTLAPDVEYRLREVVQVRVCTLAPRWRVSLRQAAVEGPSCRRRPQPRPRCPGA